MSIRVVNLKKEPCTHYCGRRTSYHANDPNYGIDCSFMGNPFNKGTTRNESLDLYRDHLWANHTHEHIAKFFEDLSRQKEIRLGCFCKPRACHCDTIVEIFNHLYPDWELGF